MSAGGERDRELENAERLARVEVQVGGVRSDVSGMREDFTDFRKEMRDMWGQVTGLIGKMTETYPTKEEVKAELALRDQRIDELEKWKEEHKKNSITRTGWKIVAWVTVGGAASGAVLTGVITYFVNLFSHH